MFCMHVSVFSAFERFDLFCRSIYRNVITLEAFPPQHSYFLIFCKHLTSEVQVKIVSLSIHTICVIAGAIPSKFWQLDFRSVKDGGFVP
jgi:hypothetical protein